MKICRSTWHSNSFLFGQPPKDRVSGKIPRATGHYKFTPLQLSSNLQVCAATCCPNEHLQICSSEMFTKTFKFTSLCRKECSVRRQSKTWSAKNISQTPELPKTSQPVQPLPFGKPEIRIQMVGRKDTNIVIQAKTSLAEYSGS